MSTYIHNISLPSGKIIGDVNHIINITHILTQTDFNRSPVLSWYEYTIIYDDNSEVTISYDTLTAASADKMFLLRYLNKAE